MNAPVTLPPKTHNNPPVAAPSNEDMLSDLQTRFPELESEQADFEAALKTYPEKIEDDEVAAALQDVLGKMKKHKSRLASYKKDEKKPWSGIVNVVMNFFTKYEDKVEEWMEVWQPRYQDYLERKKAEAQRKAEEEAERQRQEAERLRKEAEEAAERKRQAEEEERLAREREEAARLAEQEAKEDAMWAEARGELAKWEERKAEERRKDREKAEKEENATDIRQLKQLMRTATALAREAETGTLIPGSDAAGVFEDLILEGGEISRLGTKLRHSSLLDDEQRSYLQEVKEALDGWRKARQERIAAAAAEERQKAEEEAEKRRQAEAKRQAEEAASAAIREAQRKADEEATAKARADREVAEREADEAKARVKEARAESRAAAADARDAYSDQKAANKEAEVLSQDADRSENRADRIDRRLAKSTDADLSRTRGDLGTVGGLRKSWCRVITDEAALRAACGPLGEHFTTDALEGASYHWMRAHQAAWAGRERVEGELPGVVFIYETDTSIRT